MRTALELPCNETIRYNSYKMYVLVIEMDSERAHDANGQSHHINGLYAEIVSFFAARIRVIVVILIVFFLIHVTVFVHLLMQPNGTVFDCKQK